MSCKSLRRHFRPGNFFPQGEFSPFFNGWLRYNSRGRGRRSEHSAIVVARRPFRRVRYSPETGDCGTLTCHTHPARSGGTHDPNCVHGRTVERVAPLAVPSPTRARAIEDGSAVAEEPKSAAPADLPPAVDQREHAPRLLSRLFGRRRGAAQGIELLQAGKRVGGAPRDVGGVLPGPPAGHGEGSGGEDRGTDGRPPRTDAGAAVLEVARLAAAEGRLRAGQGGRGGTGAI